MPGYQPPDDPDGSGVQVVESLRERQRSELTGSRLMGVHGVWQRDGQVCNLIAGTLAADAGTVRLGSAHYGPDGLERVVWAA